MVKVKALDTYEINNIVDNELRRVPSAGDIFEVSEERLDILLGNNVYKKAFVEKIEEKKPEKEVKAYVGKNKKNVKKATI